VLKFVTFHYLLIGTVSELKTPVGINIRRTFLPLVSTTYIKGPILVLL